MQVDGADAGRGESSGRSVAAEFTASETFDIGVDLGFPVAPDCCHCALFPFTGTIHWAHITDT